MSKSFNHAFAFSFTLIATDPAGTHIPADQIRTAIINHLAAIDDSELRENIGDAHDSFEQSATDRAQTAITRAKDYWTATSDGRVIDRAGATIALCYQLPIDPVPAAKKADFIALACNAHTDMLVALEYAYHILGCVYDGEPCDVGSALQPCDDAIILAKGGG